MAIDDLYASVQGDVEREAALPSPRDLPPGRSAGSDAPLRQDTLKMVLVAGDVVAIILGAMLGHWMSGYLADASARSIVTTVVCFTVAGVWCIRGQGLLLARNSAVRVVELTKLARACVYLGVVLLLADRVLKLGLHIEQTAIACFVILTLLVVWRSINRTWLSQARARGRYLRPTVMIGSDVEALRLITLMDTHRELGVEVVALVGSRENAEKTGLTHLWRGDIDHAEWIVAECGASGVLVSPTGIDPGRFNALIRNLQREGLHIFLATGLAGIESRRLRTMSFAHEPMLYVEATKFNRSQTAVKRAFDVLVASLLVLLASPLMLVVALIVKLGDRGPIFYRQLRVGRDGALFEVIKFRTMTVGADRHVDSLAASNERNGPLFKMASDPRITRPGRWLRESSLDELPQLFNVIRGQMSLVGPRPALPSEVEKFSPELRMRELVMPGITGLWQVEARDNPSFEAYRRLDLFYVENWSITLDVLIVVATIEHIALRWVSMLARVFRRDHGELPAVNAARTR